jgi:hypothetical protein
MRHGHMNQEHIHRACDFAQVNHKKWIQLQLVIAFMWCWIFCLILGGGCFLKIIMKEPLVLKINYPIHCKKWSLWTICGLERAIIHIEWSFYSIKHLKELSSLWWSLWIGEIFKFTFCKCVWSCKMLENFHVNHYHVGLLVKNSLGKASIYLNCGGGLKPCLKISKLLFFLKHEVFLGLF